MEDERAKANKNAGYFVTDADTRQVEVCLEKQKEMAEQERNKPMKPLRTVREIMDEEYMTRGDGDGKIWTREELTEHHCIGDIIAELMAAGYSDEKIDAELQRRILRAGLAGTDANETETRTALGGIRQNTAMDKAS